MPGAQQKASRPGRAGRRLAGKAILRPETNGRYAIYRKELSLVGTRASLPRDLVTAIGLASTRAVDLDLIARPVLPEHAA